MPRGTYFVVADAAPLGAADALAFCRELPARAGVVARAGLGVPRRRRRRAHAGAVRVLQAGRGAAGGGRRGCPGSDGWLRLVHRRPRQRPVVPSARRHRRTPSVGDARWHGEPRRRRPPPRPGRRRRHDERGHRGPSARAGGRRGAGSGAARPGPSVGRPGGRRSPWRCRRPASASPRGPGTRAARSVGLAAAPPTGRRAAVRAAAHPVCRRPPRCRPRRVSRPGGDGRGRRHRRPTSGRVAGRGTRDRRRTLGGCGRRTSRSRPRCVRGAVVPRGGAIGTVAARDVPLRPGDLPAPRGRPGPGLPRPAATARRRSGAACCPSTGRRAVRRRTGRARACSRRGSASAGP